MGGGEVWIFNFCKFRRPAPNPVPRTVVLAEAAVDATAATTTAAAASSEGPRTRIPTTTRPATTIRNSTTTTVQHRTSLRTFQPTSRFSTGISTGTNIGIKPTNRQRSSEAPPAPHSDSQASLQQPPGIHSPLSP
mmetsp:Transcript_51136/g.108663  ORF Transcript_51136/g.108663 Transcript_51136/m.108663 type:complete len:135 (+) Transcript_51136:466-870(+)